MIKTYIAPMLAAGGAVVPVTRCGSGTKLGESMVYRPVWASGIGFYL